jgi:hypothetical protein
VGGDRRAGVRRLERGHRAERDGDVDGGDDGRERGHDGGDEPVDGRAGADELGELGRLDVDGDGDDGRADDGDVDRRRAGVDRRAGDVGRDVDERRRDDDDDLGIGDDDDQRRR